MICRRRTVEHLEKVLPHIARIAGTRHLAAIRFVRPATRAADAVNLGRRRALVVIALLVPVLKMSSAV